MEGCQAQCSLRSNHMDNTSKSDKHFVQGITYDLCERTTQRPTVEHKAEWPSAGKIVGNELKSVGINNRSATNQRTLEK